MTKGGDRLEQLLEVEERLKYLLTDARGVLKDLKEERQRAIKFLATEPAKTVDDAVTKRLEQIGVQSRKAMDASVKRVLSEFDRLERILLGKDDPGKEDVETLIRAYVKKDKGVG